MFSKKMSSILALVCLVVILSVTGVMGQNAAAAAKGTAIKEELRAHLKDFEFQEGYQLMLSHPQEARAIVLEEIRMWPERIMIGRCLVVLEKVGGADDAMRVLPFLCSQDDQVRLKAAKVMIALGDDRILSAIEMCLYDPNEAVRSSSIKCLEDRKTEAARAALGRFVEFEPKNENARKDRARVVDMLKAVRGNPLQPAKTENSNSPGAEEQDQCR